MPEEVVAVDISQDWRGNGTHHFVDQEGRTVAFEERHEGVRFTNELGETWFMPHVSGIAGSPTDILVAGVRFRRVPG